VWARPAPADVVELWPLARQIAAVRTRSWPVGPKARARAETWRYYIQTGPDDAPELSAQALGELILGHWRIENALHQVLDVSLGEDACRNRTGSSPWVVNWLRRVCVTLLKGSGPWPADAGFRQRQRVLANYPKHIFKLQTTSQ